MAKKLLSDGADGKVAIFDPANPSAFTKPLENLSSVFFHSDLDYVAVAKVLEVQVTHPARSAGGTSTQHSYAEPKYEGGVSPLVHGLGFKPTAICFIGNDMLPANSQIQFVGTSFRTIAVQVTEHEVGIYETAWVYNHGLPEIAMNYKIVLFTPPLEPSGDQLILVEPSRFIASRGKLDSNRNYLRHAPTNAELFFSKGKTADAGNGSFRIVTASGSIVERAPYSGSFTGEPGIGVTT